MKKVLVSQKNNYGVNRYDTLTTWETEYLAHLVRDAEDVSLGNAGINVDKAYEDSVSLLTTKSGLDVNVLTYQYVRFADSLTEKICASTWGDGTGICDASMAAVSNTGTNAFTTQFRGTNITSFDEFSHFTGLTYTSGDGASNGSFQNCTKLTSIKLPSTTYTINTYSFDGDASLASLKNTASVKQIGAYAFRNCKSLNDIGSLRPEVVRSYAFQNCKSLQNIDLTGINDSLSDSYIFDGCEKLGPSLNLANMSTVGPWCFQNCISLETLTNVDSLKNIGTYAFSGCEKLYSFSSGFAPNVVDDYSFESCQNMPSFKLGSGCTRVGKSAFINDSSLESFDFNGADCSIDSNAFFNCTKLSTVSNTGNLRRIGETAFKNCTSLDYIHLSKNGKTELANINAFDGASTNFYIGDATYPYRDNKNLKLYLNDSSWSGLDSSRFDTWYNATIDLPDGYRRVNFIQSDRVRSIDTGLDFTDDTRFVADMSFILTGTGSDGAIYGSSTAGLKGTAANGVQFSFTDHTQTLVSSSDWLDGEERLFDIDVAGNRMKVNELTKYEGEGSAAVSHDDITLFGNGNSKFMGRGWMTKIYQGGGLVRFYTPCIELSSNKVGYYDKINNTFTGYSTYLCDGVERALRDEDGIDITDEEGNTIAI